MTNATAVKPTGVTKKRKHASLDSRKARAGWFFVLPFILGFLFIYLPIIVNSLKFSFGKINLEANSFSLKWVGWTNYSDALFTDTDFVKTLFSGVQQLIIDIPCIILFSLFIAILLNGKMAGRAAFRAIFFIPVIISTGIIDRIDQANTMLNYLDPSQSIDDGSGVNTTNDIISMIDVERLFENMKVGTELVEMVVGFVNDIYGIVNRSGVQMLIFLAALQSISPAIYESCDIDGATGWETFWKITIPMISPMILVNMIYTIIDSFTSQSNKVMRYIEEVYTNNSMVLSTAMAWIYFLIVILLIGIVALIMSSYIFYQRRDK